jgi:hypothetical protein
MLFSDRLVLAVALSFCACEPGDDTKTGVVRRDVITANGTTLNGTTLNGTTLNGTTLNGTTLNGTTLNGTTLNGTTLNGTTLNGTTLNGTTLNGTTLNGTDFIGAEMSGSTIDGIALTLRIDDIVPSEEPNEDVLLYHVSYYADGTWQSICRNAAGNDVWAIPLSGRWNYAQGVPGGGAKIDDSGFVTWACVDSSISKCVFLGYKPWLTVRNNSLDPFHQSCVRLIRADYCGDGTSYTVDGQLVNLYDHLGIQRDTERWNLEAEWDTSGARCMHSDSRARSIVPCFDAKVSDGCGKRSHFQQGTLLMSEAPPISP